MDSKTREVVARCNDWFAEKMARPDLPQAHPGQTLYWLDPDRWRDSGDGVYLCSAVFTGHAGYVRANDVIWWFEPNAGRWWFEPDAGQGGE